jgi:uncharacterized repeat protein (TIGR01451 family)
MKTPSFLCPASRVARRLAAAALRGLLVVTLIVSLVRPVDTTRAAAPPAGTSIGNQASATYTDASNTPRTATSNVAVTIVQQVSSFVLTTDGQAKFAAPGGQVYYPHTLVNTGNGTDTFTLAAANAGGDNFDLNSLVLYADANGDGLPDNAIPITGTGPLAAGATFKFVAVGIVPGTETPGAVSVITITAAGTATASPAPPASNTDTTTVTGNAVINVTKALDSNSGAAGSGPYTITLTYNNSGNNTATNLTLLDLIPAGMTYVTNSARWSITGGTALTDGDGDLQGTAPDTIAYDFGITAAGRVTAVIARVQPGQSGTLSFQVRIAPGTPAGAINNTASYNYDPGTGTPVGPFNSNTAQFTVTPSASVTLSGQTITNATQGSTVSFTNLLQNTGNSSDTFDITFTNSTFPGGSTLTVYQNDGNTPMVDSNGNGTPDTGPLAAGATYNVVLKVTLPTGVSGIGVNYGVTKIATSTLNPAVSATANDLLLNVTANSVDLTANAALPGGAGAGAGPEVAAVVAATNNPGTTARFTLYVNNTSSVADTFNLAASTDSSFGSITLPAGWSVVFRDSLNAIVTGTGVILAGGNKLIYADVSIPAGQAPLTLDLYFRALSPTSGAADRLHAAVTVNTVRSLSLAPNNSGQVFSPGTVTYSHLLVNNGNVIEGDGTNSTIALSLSDSLSGWSSVVYLDANNNGIIDGGDSVLTNLHAVASGGGVGVSPGETVRLLVQVFCPPGAPIGTINASTLTATTVNGAHTTPAPAPLVANDSSTVISGDLILTKEQALDASPLDGNPDSAYSTADLSTGAIPGKSIRYRITVQNTGTATATSVKVFDTTPAYTVYTAVNPAAVTGGTVNTATTPADNTAGALVFDVGDLPAGQTAVITFGVIITQ